MCVSSGIFRQSLRREETLLSDYSAALRCIALSAALQVHGDWKGLSAFFSAHGVRWLRITAGACEGLVMGRYQLLLGMKLDRQSTR